jgi:hypothetical protein
MIHHPDGPLSNRDPQGASPDRDRRHDPIHHRIDPQYGIFIELGHPDASVSHGNATRPSADAHGADVERAAPARLRNRPGRPGAAGNSASHEEKEDACSRTTHDASSPLHPTRRCVALVPVKPEDPIVVTVVKLSRSLMF